jgi:crotonobetainyl-CoA:carnitine CoA-transferase CaiB-like acyl-CoA transferase
MNKALQALAALIALGALAIWLGTGAHRGWTMTEVANTSVDEVTGLTGGPPVKKFVAGVDFLGAGILAAGALAAVSLFFRKQTKPKPEH